MRRAVFHALLVLACALAAAPATAYAQHAASPAETNAVDGIFAQYTAETPGCIVGVGRNGAVLYASGYGMANLEHDVPLTPRMISEIGSASKQFTAAAVVLLAQDGRLSLDDEVRRHYPEFPDFGAPITIRQLLNHTSGLRDQFGLLDLAGRPNGTTVSTVDEVVALTLRQRTLNFAPGHEYLYSNTGYTFLNALVERVSGQSFAEFTTERIFRPLGMNDTQWRDDFTRVVRGRVLAYRPDGADGYRQEMPFSNLHGSGGLLTTVRDLIVWTEALHADRVNRPGFLAEMTRTGRLANGRELSYALGLTVGEFRGVPEVGHSGSTAGYRAHLVHYPQQGLTVALQCNVASANATALTRSVAAVFLADQLRPAPTAAAPVAVTLNDLGTRAGTYYNPVTHQVVRLSAANGRLSGGGFELVPVARDRFVRIGGGGGELVYVPASGARRAELRAADDGDDALRLVAMPAVTPSADELRSFTGEYYNDETGGLVRVAVEDGALVMRYAPARVIRLEPAFADAFVAGGTTVVFRRDAAGRLTGFSYHAGRVRDIRFERRS